MPGHVQTLSSLNLIIKGLSPPSSRQVWVKPAAEMQFLYGNHVLKSGLGRITEGTPAYTGVVRFHAVNSNI